MEDTCSELRDRLLCSSLKLIATLEIHSVVVPWLSSTFLTAIAPVSILKIVSFLLSSPSSITATSILVHDLLEVYSCLVVTFLFYCNILLFYFSLLYFQVVVSFILATFRDLGNHCNFSLRFNLRCTKFLL